MPGPWLGPGPGLANSAARPGGPVTARALWLMFLKGVPRLRARVIAGVGGQRMHIPQI